MAIIKQYHKDTDTTYVYESISYWDADKKQSRSKRRLIGKIDPDTGEMIATGKRGRKKISGKEVDLSELQELKRNYEEAFSGWKSAKVECEKLKRENADLKKEIQQLRSVLKNVEKSLLKNKELYDPS